MNNFWNFFNKYFSNHAVSVKNVRNVSLWWVLIIIGSNKNGTSAHEWFNSNKRHWNMRVSKEESSCAANVTSIHMEWSIQEFTKNKEHITTREFHTETFKTNSHNDLAHTSSTLKQWRFITDTREVIKINITTKYTRDTFIPVNYPAGDVQYLIPHKIFKWPK